MIRLPKQLLFIGVAAVAITVLGSLLFGSPKALADPEPYFSNDLISDSIFSNSSSMSASSVQTFLNNEGSGLAGLSFTESCNPSTPPTSSTYPYTYSYTYYPNCGNSESAATIIYDAGKAYGINPQVIMATMQKEQSLITTPYSSSGTYQASLNCATGYKSCAGGYSGFFAQVDNAAWQLRMDVDLMNGQNWWGYGPNSYPCSGSTSLYNNGLYPNNTVTFADPEYSGDPYTSSQPVTINLGDSSTAALYCYTPYVGPYTTEGSYQGTGYSGSYNFVQSFEQWFSATTTGSYLYSLLGHQLYTDSSMTTPQNSAQLVAGQRYYAVVTVQNTGYITWYQGQVNLGTWDPADRASGVKDWTWPSPNNNRAAYLQQSSVAPGGVGMYGFWVDAPPTWSGMDWEHFNLVAEGITWMPDSGLVFGFQSSQEPNYAYNLLGHQLYTDSSMTTEQNAGDLTPGQRYYAYVEVQNTGNTTWYQGQTNLGTWDPADRASGVKDWTWPSTNNNRAGTIEQSSVPPGGTATFGFWILAPPASSSVDWESFDLVNESYEGTYWMSSPQPVLFGLGS